MTIGYNYKLPCDMAMAFVCMRGRERDRESTHLSTVIIIISELQILFYDLKYGKYSQQIDGFIIAIVVQCLAALCTQTFYSESEY